MRVAALVVVVVTPPLVLWAPLNTVAHPDRHKQIDKSISERMACRRKPEN
jgi:hypothetical protein